MNREDWLSNAVSEIRPVFTALACPLPKKIAVSTGFPSIHARSLNRAIGEHHSASASSNGTHQIFISPVIADEFEVFGVLVHELAHSATDGDGHRGRFPSLVKALGLDGKPTETTVGVRFKTAYKAMVKSLGAYPHATVNVSLLHKPQGTRMLKAICAGVDCGYVFRASKTHTDKGLPTCVCGSKFILAS